jgi:hypothetical protein
MATPQVIGSGFPGRANFAFNGSLNVPKYTLMFHDADDVKPAASQSDAGNEAANQDEFAQKFAGVAMDTRSASDTGAVVDFPVATDIVMEVDCASATFEVGDKVTVVEQSNGTQLENQKVVKTAVESRAIGTVYKRYGSATTRVLVRFMSRVLPNSAVIPDMDDEVSSLTTPIIIMDGANGENEIRLPNNLADALSIEDGTGDIITINTSTGAHVIGLQKNTTLAGTFIQTSAAAAAFAVGRQGATAPALAVKADVSSCVTGLLVTARAATAGVDLTVTSSETNESLLISAKGTGNVRIGSDLTVIDSTTGNLIETIAAEDKIGFFGATPVVQPGSWAITNFTEDKEFAGDSSTAADAVKAVASLVNDLIGLGILDGTVSAP